MSYSRSTGGNYYRSSMFGGFSFFPPVIKSLLIANGAVFALMMFIGLFSIDGVPLARFIGEVVPLYPIGNGFQVWQLVTYMFMHGSFMHLLFNMFALWMFGLELENEWGSKKFLTYYAICGLGPASTLRTPMAFLGHADGLVRTSPDPICRRTGGHDQAPRHRQGQRRQGLDAGCRPRSRSPPGRRQRGGCIGAASLGDRARARVRVNRWSTVGNRSLDVVRRWRLGFQSVR